MKNFEAKVNLAILNILEDVLEYENRILAYRKLSIKEEIYIWMINFLLKRLQNVFEKLCKNVN